AAARNLPRPGPGPLRPRRGRRCRGARRRNSGLGAPARAGRRRERARIHVPAPMSSTGPRSVTIAATRSIRRAALGTALLTMALAGSAAAQTPPRELSLEEAIRLAHMYNPDYLAQEVQAERAAWANRQAWAGFLPTANVSQTLGYSRSEE